MDGTKSLEGGLESSGFHPGRNYLSVDGAKSQKLLGSFPSDKAFLIDDVWGDKKCLFGVHRDRNSLNADGSTTATVIKAVRWLINGCQTEEDNSGQALVFHRLSASTESDGV